MSETNIAPFREGGTTQLAELTRHELRRNINEIHDSVGMIGIIRPPAVYNKNLIATTPQSNFSWTKLKQLNYCLV